MKDEYKVLTERDFKKELQTVYTLTPADLRFMLVEGGIKKERIEMAHVCRNGHEWLRVMIHDDDGNGYVSCTFPIDGAKKNEQDA